MNQTETLVDIVNILENINGTYQTKISAEIKGVKGHFNIDKNNGIFNVSFVVNETKSRINHNKFNSAQAVLDYMKEHLHNRKWFGDRLIPNETWEIENKLQRIVFELQSLEVPKCSNCNKWTEGFENNKTNSNHCCYKCHVDSYKASISIKIRNTMEQRYPIRHY